MADRTLTQIVDLIESEATAPELRLGAVRVAGAVGSIKERALVAALARLLPSESAELRAAAMTSLGQLKADEIAPHLETYLRRGGAELEAAANAAVQLGARGSKLLQKILPSLLPTLRARVADAVAKSGALELTAHGLLDADATVVDNSARSLLSEAASYSRAQRNSLVKFLHDGLDNHDPSAKSRAAMLRVLAVVQEDGAQEIFWKYLGDEHARVVRLAALHGLGALDAPPSDARLQKLFACAQDVDFQVVAAALMLLKQVPVHKKHAKLWFNLLQAPDVATRRFAVERLQEVQTAEAASAIASQLSHPDRALRELTLRTLVAFEQGRKALLDGMLACATADETWTQARAFGALAKELSDDEREWLFAHAVKLQDAEDRRAAPLWFLLREFAPAWVRDQVADKALALRKKKKFAEALQYFRLLTQDPACAEDLRFEQAATGLKVSSQELAPDARNADPALHQFGRLVQNASFDLLAKLTAAKWLDPEDLFYLGFHLAEQTHRVRDLGKEVLGLVVQRSPKSELGKHAKRKLKSEGL